MTFNLTSTTDTEANVKAALAPSSVADAQSEKSAPEAKAAELQTASDSDTEETESKVEANDGSEDDGDDESLEATDAADDKPKKKSGSQRRKERAERAEADAKAARAEAEHWRTMALKGAGEPKAEAPKQEAASGEPSPDDFDTHQAYVKALTKWTVDESNTARERDAQKAKLVSEQEKAFNAHKERVKSFAAKTKDFNEVVEAVDDIPVSATIGEIILSSDNGPELMYELAKNREEYERICKLSPLAAARELGRIESRINSSGSEESKPEPKKITQATKPIAPVGSKGAHVGKDIYKDAATMTLKEWEAARAKQREARG